MLAHCSSIPQVQPLLSLIQSTLALFLQTSILTIELALLASIPLFMSLPLGGYGLGRLNIKEVNPHLRRGIAEKQSGKTTLGTSEQDSKLDLPVLSSLAQHETSALANYATEAGIYMFVMEEIESNGIKLYPLPDCDSDEDEDYKEQVRQLKEAVPFAVCGANTLLEVRGRKVRGRLYPWGVVEVENPDHCDFIKTHMQDLQEVTQEVHYENYRSERLAKGAPVPKRQT
ncbi:unnamed protein product [Timema podura]|uniref:Septin-type G domain-containing protein n=1 Tax=Timema podura TaxID=61482 RepID=A0ABN7P129_TIMPD|nr:unnamed protein product [Timema podura]